MLDTRPFPPRFFPAGPTHVPQTAFDRCVIQPDVWDRCTRRAGALVEWRVYGNFDIIFTIFVIFLVFTSMIPTTPPCHRLYCNIFGFHLDDPNHAAVS